MLNHITIMGRLTREPELRYTQAQVPVASFTVACERDYAQNGQREADFIDCVAWRGTGEFVQKYFQKGSMIVVTGRLQSRKWRDRDGNNRTSWEVNADSVYFGESRRDNQQNQQYGTQGNYVPQNAYQQARPVNVQPPQTFDGFQEMPAGTGADNPFTGANAGYQQAGMWDNGDGELPF